MRISALAIVLAVATAVFAGGAIAERSVSDEHCEPVAAENAESDEAAHVEGKEEEGEHAERGETAGTASEEAHAEDERLLGVDLESTPLVVLAVLFGLALAGLAASGFRLRREFLIAVVVIALAWAALDVRELLHQIDESREGIAIAAGAVALLHVLAAGLAGRSLPAAQ